MRTVTKITGAVLAGVVAVSLALPAMAEVVRGRDLLTPAEMQSFRIEMQAAKTAEDRDAVRAKIMQIAEARAAERDDVLMHQAYPDGVPAAPGCLRGGVGPGPRGPHGPFWGGGFRGGPGPGPWR